jgi:hypothetical protein
MRGPITISGVTYSLNHLNTELIRDVPMTDFVGRQFKKPVLIVYSCHCYSKGETDSFRITAPSHEVIWDGQWPRQFCAERYNLSTILPGVVNRLLFSPHAHVWDTGKGNRHYHELVTTPNINSQVPYYIFMRIEKTQIANDGPHVIKMAVESAYPIHFPDPAPREQDALTMSVWLGKTWAPPQPGAVKNKSNRKKKRKEPR